MIDYHPATLSEFANPYGVGELDNAIILESGQVDSLGVIRFYLLIENDKIKTIRFKAFGCVSVIAACSLVCRSVEGQLLTQAKTLTANEIIQKLHLPNIKYPMAIFVEQTFISALKFCEDK
ncbi:MAG: iron-sulfur cluster assembly scaffold protein [Legionellales bacterium]|nr:iron-sulfur cluster assembly scaffold protein [Legionellales bacterium]